MMKNLKTKRFLSAVLSVALIFTMLTSMWVYSASADTPVAKAAEAAAPDLGGDGTADSPFQIEDEEDLEIMRDHINAMEYYTSDSGEKAYTEAYYVLTSDIELDGSESWNPIGRASNGISMDVYFGGTFDAQGYTISGLYIDTTASKTRYYTAGLFGYNTGTIKNLTVSGTVDASMWNGIIVARNAGTVENCASSGNVQGAYANGGIVGVNRGGTIKNCYTTSNAPVYASSYANETTDPIVENTYYLDTVAGDNIAGVTEPMSDDDFKSGKVTWLLQNGVDSDDLVWEQVIDTDELPKLHKADDSDNGTVYQVLLYFDTTGIIVDEMYVNKDAQFSRPDVEFEIDGYKLGESWYPSEKLGGHDDINFPLAITEDTKLYAQKTAIQYNINYDLGDGSWANTADTTGHPATYTVEDEITLDQPINGDNAFAGWTGTDIIGAAQLTVTIPQGSTGDRSYTAHYYDGSAPLATITIGDHAWGYSHENVGSDLFFNTSQTVSITATDNEDASVEIYYYISNSELSGEELKALADEDWKLYGGEFTIGPPSETVVIYAKASDDNGNTVYVNTSEIKFDITDPVISGVTDGNTYCLSASFTVDEVNLASVTVDKDGALTEADGTYTLSSNGTYTITATDKAGNTAAVTITVSEHEAGLVTEAILVNPACETTGAKLITTYCKNCNQVIKTENVTLDALEHDWTDWETILMPSCEDEGTQQRTCQRCYRTETQNLNKEGHTWDSGYTVDKPATCTSAGSESIHCQKCGAQDQSREIPILNHDNDIIRIENEVAATCTANGSFDTVVYCSMCQQEQSRTPGTTPATGHSFSEWETLSTPNCEDEGIQQRKCSTCGFIDTKNLSANGHTWAKDYTTDQAATCTVDGSESIKCEVCGATLESRPITAPGHTPAETPVKSVILQATCEDNGSYDMIYYCTVCGEEANREHFVENALGHDWSAWYLIDSPDCEDEGAERRDCSRCQLTETRGVAATGHDWETEDDGSNKYTEDLAATCTQPGSESVHCTKCTAVLDSRTIDPLGHDWGEGDGWKVIDSPSCEDSGTKMRTCKRCGITETEGLNPNGHDWNTEPTIDSAATCTTDGSKSIHCKNCSATISSETIPATGHKFGDWETITSPTCQNTGVQQRVCEVCQYTETAALDATGNHIIPVDENGETIYTIVEATCTTDGSKSVLCEVCGVALESEVLPALGHDFVDGICSRCGANDGTAPLPEILVDGTDQEYVIGSDGGAAIHCDGILKWFVSVSVDGKIVDAKYYTVSEGSTIITFTSAFLDTLAPGDHDVTLTFTYGEASATLKVIEKEEESTTKKPTTESTTKPSDEPLTEPTTKAPESEKPEGNTSSTSPSTGSARYILGASGAVLFAAIGLTFASKKRKEDEE